MYLTLKFFHILLAIIAVGFTSSFGLILGRARAGGADGREMKFALQTTNLMGRISHILFLIVTLIGVAMVQMAGFGYRPIWIHGSLALFLIAFLIGSFVMPALFRRRLAILAAKGPSDPEFVALSKRAAMIGGILGLLTLAILWMMIAKP